MYVSVSDFVLNDWSEVNIPMYVRTDIEPSELPHASIRPNS